MRRASIVVSALAGLALLAAAEAQAKSPPRDVLGIRLGMSEAEVHRRLARIGVEAGYAPAKREKRKEMWELRDQRIASVAIKFDDEGRLSWITAFARADGKRLRYRDVVDLTKAERLGFYIYVWRVPARGEQPAYALTARGAGPEYVGNYSIYRLPGAGGDEDEELD
jgi:hypothetical protein